MTQWYVTDGYIYYYLAGADFWRTNLETGKNEKLAQTSDVTIRGDAVFSDQYLCLLDNDEFDLQELEYSGEIMLREAFHWIVTKRDVTILTRNYFQWQQGLSI